VGIFPQILPSFICIVKLSSVDIEEEHSSTGLLDFPRPLGDELKEQTANFSEIQKGRLEAAGGFEPPNKGFADRNERFTNSY